MADTATSLKLTSEGAMRVLQAAAKKAADMGVPQCITVVDPGGHLLAFMRMDGAFVQSIATSMKKAMTAASYSEPTGNIAEGIDLRLAIATQGNRINLPGGLPIIVDGHTIGGIGVGSGTGGQDLEVAKAGVAALAGARRFD
jgi:glc operon protein GlcG